MSKYEPCITVTKRNEKFALWVNMPSGDKYNIWDLDTKEFTPTVIDAIASAFERGMLAQKQLISQATQTRFPTIDKRIKSK